MIKALIVEDSGFMRIRISDVLRSSKDIEVVGTAINGADGLKAIIEKQPDVVITDMVMPNYDGVYLVKEAMKRNPVPIIVLSSLDRNSEQVFEALASGAFAFIDKPRSERGLGFNRPLIDLVKAAAEVETSSLYYKHEKRNDLEHTFDTHQHYDIVAIGASTGGPSAIETFVEGLPANFPVPVVIAQHMPPRFIEAFASRLNGYTNLTVKVADKGEELKPQFIYLCPGDVNTTIVKSAMTGKPIFAKTTRQFIDFNDPSVNCMFESAADIYGKKMIGLIFTGMGKDGTDGLVKLKGKGGLVIAQDESSSVVFGMPKAAIDAQVVDYTLKIKEMAGFVTSCFS